MESATTFHVLGSIHHQQPRTPARLDNLTPVSPSPRSRVNLLISGPGRRTIGFPRCSMRTGVDSNNPKNYKNPAAVEVDHTTKTRPLEGPPPPDKAATSTSSRGLVLDMGPAGSWDSAEIGSPVVKRYIGDNEERWYMWYHGRSVREDSVMDQDSIGLATSCNGIHWSRGDGKVVRSCGEAGIVMECRDNWWAFDTDGVRPSELVVMSSPMYSSVYWLYYTGYYGSEEAAECPANPTLRSLPGLACSQDGRNWARIEGDHHSGALLDVGSGNEWDSLFIASPKVVVHSGDDVRMFYHSFDRETGKYAVGLARSRDGIRWVKCGKIAMECRSDGSDDSFDRLGIKGACVVKNPRDGTYLMAYEAVADNGRTSIGVAESNDGLKNWRRVKDGPVLEASGSDGWDSLGVGSPSLVPMEGHEDEWRLYYVGTGIDGRTGIGMAISEGSDTRSFRRWSGIPL